MDNEIARILDKRSEVLNKVRIIVGKLEALEEDPALHGMEQCDISEVVYILKRMI